jgi:hypothetical protein
VALGKKGSLKPSNGANSDALSGVQETNSPRRVWNLDRRKKVEVAKSGHDRVQKLWVSFIHYWTGVQVGRIFSFRTREIRHWFIGWKLKYTGIWIGFPPGGTDRCWHMVSHALTTISPCTPV